MVLFQKSLKKKKNWNKIKLRPPSPPKRKTQPSGYGGVIGAHNHIGAAKHMPEFPRLQNPR